MEVHDAVLEFEAGDRRPIQDAQVPRVSVLDVVAVRPPGLRRRILIALPKEGFPCRLVVAQRQVRTGHDVADLFLLQVARLGHHDDIGLEGHASLLERLDFRSEARDLNRRRGPAHQRAVEDEVPLREPLAGTGRFIPEVRHGRRRRGDARRRLMWGRQCGSVAVSSSTSSLKRMSRWWDKATTPRRRSTSSSCSGPVREEPDPLIGIPTDDSIGSAGWIPVEVSAIRSPPSSAPG